MGEKPYLNALIQTIETQIPSMSTLNNREDIQTALTLASHLEHGLSLVYMFAAFSLRKNQTDYPGYATASAADVPCDGG